MNEWECYKQLILLLIFCDAVGQPKEAVHYVCNEKFQKRFNLSGIMPWEQRCFSSVLVNLADT